MATEEPTSTTATVDTDTFDAKALLRVLMAVKKGDFSVRLPIEEIGVSGKIADTLNEIIEMNDRLAKELDRR